MAIWLSPVVEEPRAPRCLLRSRTSEFAPTDGQVLRCLRLKMCSLGISKGSTQLRPLSWVQVFKYPFSSDPHVPSQFHWVQVCIPIFPIHSISGAPRVKDVSFLASHSMWASGRCYCCRWSSRPSSGLRLSACLWLGASCFCILHTTVANFLDIVSWCLPSRGWSLTCCLCSQRQELGSH